MEEKQSSRARLEKAKRRRRDWIEQNSQLPLPLAQAQAKEQALRLLDRQVRSRAQLQTQLLQQGFILEAIDLALDRLEQVNLLNDSEFAALLVRTRFKERGLVGRALAEQLRQKKLDPNQYGYLIDAISGVEQSQRALEIARNKVRGLGALNDQVMLRRIVATLGRKGYSADQCWSAAKTALAERIDQ